MNKVLRTIVSVSFCSRQLLSGGSDTCLSGGGFKLFHHLSGGDNVNKNLICLLRKSKLPQSPLLTSSRMSHVKCRAEFYECGKDKIARATVSDDQVSWASAWPGYSPAEFTAPFVLTAVWADPDIGALGFDPKWNSLDEKVNRMSHEGEYKVEDGRPLNIRGRTGLVGRGVLGKWGPNHAADPIVTRWKRSGETGEVETDPGTGKRILEFVSIQRRDTGEWAIPGGMVDPGETVSVTVKREFMEEALDSTDSGKENIAELQEMVGKFFEGGEEVYKGYVDDPRNTDNAWMETVALHFHDDTGDSVGQFPLVAGDDAKAITWMSLHSGLELYASHSEMLRRVVEMMGAHW